MRIGSSITLLCQSVILAALVGKEFGWVGVSAVVASYGLGALINWWQDNKTTTF